MRKLLVSLAMFTGVTCGSAAYAAEVGRYRAIPLEGEGPGRGSSRVLIIDSQEGHVWTWSGNELVSESGNSRRYGAAFIYQGKVRPGNKVGEIIDSQPR